MKILIDTNIIIDYVLERAGFVEYAKKIMQKAYNGECNAFVTASSITDIYYITQKYKNKELAFSFLQNLMSFIDVSGVDFENS